MSTKGSSKKSTVDSWKLQIFISMYDLLYVSSR